MNVFELARAKGEIMRFRNLLLAFVYCVSVGCSGHEIDLVQTGKYPIELEITDGFMASTIVTEKDGKLLVTGRVVRTDHKRRRINGYVEISALNPDGKKFEAVKANYTPWASRRSRSKSTFEATLQSLPPAGTKLRIKHVVVVPEWESS